MIRHDRYDVSESVWTKRRGGGTGVPGASSAFHGGSVIATIVVMLCAAVVVADVSAQDARALLDQADRIFELDRVYSRSTLEVTRGGRRQAPQVMVGYELDAADGTSRSLTVFESPPRVEGTAYLMIGDDLWVRFASTGRTRKLSSSAKQNSAAGSDFSYADMGEGSASFSRKYHASYDGTETIDGVACHRLILEPRRGAQDTYERLTAWITQDEERYQRIQYHDNGAPIKVMDLDDFRPVGGVAYPFSVTMRNLTRDSVSTISTTELEYDSSRVHERFFTTAYLQTIR